MTTKTPLVVGGGLVQDTTVCWLPYQPRPFVHGWVLTSDGGRDVWLRSDGLWTTDETDETVSLPATFERKQEVVQ